MKEAKKNALKEVLPKAERFKGLDSEQPFHLQKIYKAINSQGELAGYAVSLSSNGYGGPLDMMIGVDSEFKVTGVNVLRMTETPGLGTKINDIKRLPGQNFTFMQQFIGKNKNTKFQVPDDIVGITGATITSKAVANGVKDAFKVLAELKQ
jgi:Na+-translocating ferredoxin:NAD+ oxidoreductase subunit G